MHIIPLHGGYYFSSFPHLWLISFTLWSALSQFLSFFFIATSHACSTCVARKMIRFSEPKHDITTSHWDLKKSDWKCFSNHAMTSSVGPWQCTNNYTLWSLQCLVIYHHILNLTSFNLPLRSIEYLYCFFIPAYLILIIILLIPTDFCETYKHISYNGYMLCNISSYRYRFTTALSWHI